MLIFVSTKTIRTNKNNKHKMANLITKTAKGFSKEAALESIGLNKDLFKFDSTMAYRNAVEKDELVSIEDFAQKQIDAKAKGLPGVGFSVTVTSGKEDSRERPYKEQVVVTTQARKYKTQYALVTGSETLEGGKIVAFADDKSKARKAAKDFVTANKETVTVFPIKVVSEGESVATKVEYTPSIGTKEGEYLFFILEA